MQKLSMKKWSVLGVVLLAASAVTAAIIPSRSDSKLVNDGSLRQDSATAADGDMVNSCITDNDGAATCTASTNGAGTGTTGVGGGTAGLGNPQTLNDTSITATSRYPS